MSYSSVDMTQGRSATGAMVGAAIGAVVGAVVLAAVVAVDRAVYTPTTSLFAPATAVRPAVATGATVSVSAPQSFVQGRVAGAQYAATQRRAYEVGQETVMQAPQGIAVYSWAWVVFAAVAGAVNGLFLWNNKRVAMAANTGRREALMAGVAAASMAAGPAFAAYGEAANVFGKSKDVEQFADVSGDGWKGLLPSKFNPSSEREFPGIVARWEDNFDAVNNATVIVLDGGKNAATELGSLDDVRNNYVTKLIGEQAFGGKSISEGGFAPGRYGSAAILEQKQITKDGKPYYFYELLSRSADGNEGGRHQLFLVGASKGKTIIYKVQAGDKRWFKGLEKLLRKCIDAFTVL